MSSVSEDKMKSLHIWSRQVSIRDVFVVYDAYDSQTRLKAKELHRSGRLSRAFSRGLRQLQTLNPAYSRSETLWNLFVSGILYQICDFGFFNRCF